MDGWMDMDGYSLDTSIRVPAIERLKSTTVDKKKEKEIQFIKYKIVTNHEHSSLRIVRMNQFEIDNSDMDGKHLHQKCFF